MLLRFKFILSEPVILVLVIESDMMIKEVENCPIRQSNMMVVHLQNLSLITIILLCIITILQSVLRGSPLHNPWDVELLSWALVLGSS